MRLGSYVWPELDGGSYILVLPLGSTEQHGPHLPLDTDTRIAVALAEALAARRDSILVAPALMYGASWEHVGFAGTLAISVGVLENVLVEIVRSAGPEIERVVFVNGHGGNSTALARAVDVLVGEGRQAQAWAPIVRRGDAHAGRTETSLLLAIDPDAVRVGCAARGNTRPLAEIADALRSGGVKAVSDNGVLGDPQGATAEEGHQLLRELVNDLEQAVFSDG